MVKYKLTTFDNPFSPFDEFEKWYDFDERVKHYHTSEYLSRIEDTYEDLDDDAANQAAIDEIVHYNVLGVWCKITKDQATELMKSRN